MTNLVSTAPSRFSVIRPDLLPAMRVLEQIDTEKILSNRMAQLVELWNSYDPPNAAQYDVGGTEFDPIKISQELNAYFELMVRDRVNQAARAITLVYAVGSDLDAIASRYPFGVPRKSTTTVVNGIETTVYESDEEYRTRVWLSPNVLSLNGPGMGTYESYVFWAMSAPQPAGTSDIKHAAALTKRASGVVTIPLITTATFPDPTIQYTPDGRPIASITGIPDPTPSSTQITTVYRYINEEGTARKGLTDVVNVVKPKVIHTTIDVDVYSFPGIDPLTLMQNIGTSIHDLLIAIRWLGADLTILSLQGALALSGVYRSVIRSPSTDIAGEMDSVVYCTSVRVEYKGTGE